MSEDRRYSESEIASIFRYASDIQEAARRKISPSEGLTLEELQQIGREAGITPEYVARAVAAVDRADSAPTPRKFVGLPVTAARTVQLPGPLTDRNWDLLVGDLREVFHAAGEVRRDGAFREWRNGNLHVHAEPAETGHRLRFHTTNDVSRLGLGGGLVFLVMGLFFMLMLALEGDFMVVLDKTLFVSMFAIVGVAIAGAAAYRLPRWAKERGHQMDEVAARTIERIGAKQAPESLEEADAADSLQFDRTDESEEEVRPRRPGRTRS